VAVHLWSGKKMANELTLTVPKEVLDKAYADSVKELAGVLGIEAER
jgi:hypothetical protein